jgi:hypothetical protein
MSIETNYGAANLRFTFALEIDGFPFRYYSHEAPAETGSVTVRLRYGGNTSGLLRVGQRGATNATYITAEIESAAAGTTEVISVEDSSWVSPGATIWIGQEALLVNSVPSGTTINVDRGHLLSETQWHRIDTETQTRPIVTSECVAFRTRRCRLRAYAVRGTTVDATGIDIIRGFIDETPRLSDDGLTIEVTIAPDSARLEQELPSEQGAVSAGLVHGEHYFTGSGSGNGSGNGSATLFYRLPAGAAIDSRAWGGVVAGVFAPGGTPDERDQNCDMLDDMFDTAWGTDDARNGALNFQNHNGTEAITNIDTVNDQITCGTLNLPFTRRFINPPLGHTKNARWFDGTAASLERWPDVMLAEWGSTFRPSSTRQVDDGAWADVTLEPTAVRVNLNARFDRIIVGLPSLDWLDWGDGPGVAATIEVSPTDDDGGLVGVTQPIGGIATGFYQSGETEFLLTDNLAGSGSLPLWVRIDAYVPALGKVSTQAVKVDAITPVTLSSGATAYRYNIRTFTARVFDGTDVDPLTSRWIDNPTFPYSFCDFDYLPPDERCKVTPILMTSGSADLTGTVLEVLQSKYGDGVRGSSDVITDGLGLRSAIELDEESFTRATTPPGLDQTAFAFDDERTVADIIGPMLRAAGYALTPRLSLANGRRLVSLVPMRRASSVQSRLALTRADFISEPSVASITDDEIVNRIVYQAPGDDGIRVEFRDVDSIGRNGERQTQEEELIGFVPTGDTIGNDAATMQPIALRRFALVGTPRRVIRGTVRLGLGLLVDPGDVITLTHSDALDYTGGRGLSSAPMLVVSVRRDFESATAELDLVYHGANLSGFAPSLEVVSIIDASTVEVAPNRFTQTANPVNGEAIEDLNYWAAGDVALMVSDPLGAGWPAGYERTVDSIDIAVSEITFTAAHGLSVGDYIRSASYTSASAAHQAFAYLSDGDEIAAGVVTLEHD